jgi:hypothetical protein
MIVSQFAFRAILAFFVLNPLFSQAQTIPCPEIECGNTSPTGDLLPDILNDNTNDADVPVIESPPIIIIADPVVIGTETITINPTTPKPEPKPVVLQLDVDGVLILPPNTAPTAAERSEWFAVLASFNVPADMMSDIIRNRLGIKQADFHAFVTLLASGNVDLNLLVAFNLMQEGMLALVTPESVRTPAQTQLVDALTRYYIDQRRTMALSLQQQWNAFKAEHDVGGGFSQLIDTGPDAGQFNPDVPLPNIPASYAERLFGGGGVSGDANILPFGLTPVNLAFSTVGIVTSSAMGASPVQAAGALIAAGMYGPVSVQQIVSAMLPGATVAAIVAVAGMATVDAIGEIIEVDKMDSDIEAMVAALDDPVNLRQVVLVPFDADGNPTMDLQGFQMMMLGMFLGN